MTLIQKRPYELAIYQQLAAGDVGFESPTVIWVMVDKVGWTEPKRIPLSELFSASHAESEFLSPASVNVSVTYGQSFESSSYYYDIKAYKTVTIPSVGDVQETVAFFDLETTVNGFSLTLSEYVGVTVSYLVFELALGAEFSKDYIYADGAAAGLVVPDYTGTERVQITGLTNQESQGIALSSNSFTLNRTAKYLIDISFALFTTSASNIMAIDVMSEVPAALGITRQFKPVIANDYENYGVRGIISATEGDIVRFYLTAAGTGATVSLSTITINIIQI